MMGMCPSGHPPMLSSDCFVIMYLSFVVMDNVMEYSLSVFLSLSLSLSHTHTHLSAYVSVTQPTPYILGLIIRDKLENKNYYAAQANNYRNPRTHECTRRPTLHRVRKMSLHCFPWITSTNVNVSLQFVAQIMWRNHDVIENDVFAGRWHRLCNTKKTTVEKNGNSRFDRL